MSEHLRHQWRQRAREAGRYTFDVIYAADKDAIMSGQVASGTRRVTVEADSITDGQLLAEQMVAARGWEPVDTIAISWPEHEAKVAVSMAHPLWHLTDTKDFKVNPEHAPAGYEGYQHQPGLFVTPNPELWANLWGFRQWAAEIDVSALDGNEIQDDSMQDRDQFFIPASALGKVKVKRVVSVDKAYREALTHGYGFAFLAPSERGRLCVADGFGSDIGMCGRKMDSFGAMQKWTTIRWALDFPQTCDECKVELRKDLR